MNRKGYYKGAGTIGHVGDVVIPRTRVKVARSFSRDWSNINGPSKAIFECDIGVSDTSKIKMKLLVFKNNRDLCRFWRLFMGASLSKYTCGVVNSLSNDVISFKGGKETRWTEVDKRYFAVMGLLETHLTMEILSHESVHAGFAYCMRTRGRCKWPGATDNPEENIAYPTGRIGRAVVNALLKAKLLP